jgi:hypothetical protein
VDDVISGSQVQAYPAGFQADQEKLDGRVILEQVYLRLAFDCLPVQVSIWCLWRPVRNYTKHESAVSFRQPV